MQMSFKKIVSLFVLIIIAGIFIHEGVHVIQVNLDPLVAIEKFNIPGIHGFNIIEIELVYSPDLSLEDVERRRIYYESQAVFIEIIWIIGTMLIVLWNNSKKLEGS